MINNSLLLGQLEHHMQIEKLRWMYIDPWCKNFSKDDDNSEKVGTSEPDCLSNLFIENYEQSKASCN